MNARTLEKDDVMQQPMINPWRQAPSREQVRYVTALCRSELPYAERQRTLASLPLLDGREVSALISELREVRARRLDRLRAARRRRR